LDFSDNLGFGVVTSGDADSSFIDPTMDLSNIDIDTDSITTTSTITTITIDDE
jgi:hypothetical protein